MKKIIDLKEGRDYTHTPPKSLFFTGSKRRKSAHDEYKYTVNKPKPTNDKRYLRPWVLIALGAASLYGCQVWASHSREQYAQQQLVADQADVNYHLASEYYIAFCRKETKQEHLKPWEIDWKFIGCSMPAPVHPLYKRVKR